MKFYFKYTAQLVLAFGISSAAAQADQAVFQAVATDDASTLSTLFLRGADPNALSAKGQTALNLALQTGSFRAAEQVFSHPDTKVDLPNAQGETPLMLAALKGHVDWMQKLLARGASPGRAGWSPLHYAAAGPSVAAVRLLLDRGAAIDALSPNGTTPLMMASRYGAEDAARLLLQRGARAAPRNEQQLDAAAFARHVGREALAADLAQAAQAGR